MSASLRPSAAVIGQAQQRRGVRRTDLAFDRALHALCVFASLLAVLAIVAIAYQVINGATPAISQFGLGFVGHSDWKPNFGVFGAATLIYGTAVSSGMALLLAVPLGVAIGLYLSMLAPGRVRSVIGPLVEMLAAIPSVIVGFWGILVLGPFLQGHLEPGLHGTFGFLPIFGAAPTTGAGLFNAGLLLTIMVLPIIASLSRDLFLTVPRELQDGATALGATRWEVIRGVVLPSAASGVAAAAFLGLGRALGEAIAVTQVVGAGSSIHASLFETGDTLASRIAGQFQGAATQLQTASLFYLGVILLGIGLVTNILTQLIARRFDAPHASRLTDRLGIGRTSRRPGSEGPGDLSASRDASESVDSPLSTRGEDSPRRTDFLSVGGDTGPPDPPGLQSDDLDPGRPLTASGNLRRRRAVSRLAESGATAAALLAVAMLGILVYSVVSRGASALSIDFLTQDPPLFGGPGGGIAPAIVGTALLVAVSTAIAMPIAVLVALYLTEFARPRPARAIRLALDLLNGLPTIIIALFVFGLLVVGLHHQSGFAGAFALAIVMLPLIARAAQEVLLLVPRDLREAADALGVNRWRMIRGVLLPAALGGILTGTVLAVARASGETAPLLLTCSIFGNHVSVDVFGQALPNIPVSIFQLSESADPAGFSRAWGAALVLVGMILVASLGARALLTRSRAKLTR